MVTRKEKQGSKSLKEYFFVLIITYRSKFCVIIDRDIHISIEYKIL